MRSLVQRVQPPPPRPEMAPYDDWNKLDEEEDEELQDTSVRMLAINRIVTLDS